MVDELSDSGLNTDMKREIRQALREGILNHLQPYLLKCKSHYLGGSDDLIELIIVENEKDVSQQLVICVGILDKSTQLHISNISFPKSWRGNNDGMRLIDVVYQIAKKYGYALFITQCTEGFYNLLLGTCGALQTDCDTVQITDKTCFMNSGHLASRQFGDCYESSYQAAVEIDQIRESGVFDDEVKIIHGRITPLSGVDAGREIPHAWVEVTGLVLETSNGQQEKFSKEKFYTLLQAICDQAYTCQEAEELIKKSGKFGRWRETGMVDR